MYPNQFISRAARGRCLGGLVFTAGVAICLQAVSTARADNPAYLGVFDDGHTPETPNAGKILMRSGDLFLTPEGHLFFHGGPVEGVPPMRAIAASGTCGCGLGANGTVQCWERIAGQSKQVVDAYPVMGLVSPTKVVSSCDQACVLEAAGNVSCWNHRKDDTRPPKATTVHRIESLDNVTDISVAWKSACAVTRGGGVFCWGDPLAWRNWTGKPGELYERLAAVPERTKLIPKQVPGLRGIVAIAGSERSMCAVSRRGLVYCWGVSLAEEWPLTGGVDDMPMESRPRLVGGVKDAVEISISGGLACARTRRGTVLCWGFQGVGLHRDGTPLRAFVYPPVQVPGISGAVSISERCARFADGKAICWSGI